MEIFCSADTTKNYLPLDIGKIFITPMSTVLTSFLTYLFLLLSFRSRLNTDVYSPPNINVPLSKYNILST